MQPTQYCTNKCQDYLASLILHWNKATSNIANLLWLFDDENIFSFIKVFIMGNFWSLSQSTKTFHLNWYDSKWYLLTNNSNEMKSNYVDLLKKSSEKMETILCFCILYNQFVDIESFCQYMLLEIDNVRRWRKKKKNQSTLEMIRMK